MCKTKNNTNHEDELHLELIFRQSIVGVFTMMLDYPIVWNETVDKDAVLNYVFHHQHITRFNQVMLKLHRTTEAEMLKRTPADFFSYNIKQGRAIWHRLFDQGQLIAETEVMLADQSIIWVEGEYRCLYDDKGRIIGHVGVVHDVTNRKKAEQWSQYLATVVDQISDAIVVTDRDCKIVLVNQATEKLFGYRQEELLGLSPQVFRAEPVATSRPSHIFAAVLSGGFHSEELACRRKDGSIFTCELRVTRINDGQGQPIAYVGLQRDVTEQRRLERAYRDSLDRFNQLARQARVYTWEVDASGLYTYVSDTVLAVIGYSADEIAGKMHFYDLVVSQERDRIKKAALHYFDEQNPFVDFYNAVRSKDGEIVYLVTNALPVVDDKGILLGYRGSDRDMTAMVTMQNTIIADKECYRTTLMSVGDGVISTDGIGQVNVMNPAAERLTGWTQRESAGRHLTEILHLANKESLVPEMDYMQALFREDLSLVLSDWQAILLGRSGKAVAISLKAAPIVDSNGQTTGIVLVLRSMNDKRDQQHLDRVTHYCETLARALGLSDSEITECVMAASLHELKKTAFLRNPRRLTEDLADIVQRDSCGINNRVLDAVQHQHERWNGSGQPDQLAGKEIPLLSRILAVADSYDVMTSEGTDLSRQRRNEAIAVLQKNKGILFDPFLVQAFIEKVLQNELPGQQI